MAKKPSDAIQRANAAILERITGVRRWIRSRHRLKQFALIQMNMGREVCRRLREANSRLFSAKMGTPEADVGHIFLAD